MNSGNAVIETDTLRVRRVEIRVYRAPIGTPVTTSFGVMRDRPSVLLRLEDESGAHGWGEVWCNFPDCGAEHRAGLLRSVFAPLLLEREFRGPSEAAAELARATHTLMLQTAEYGPIQQCLAGADDALWDLAARKAGLPLHRLLGGKGEGVVPAYASGINPAGCLETVEACRAAGYRAFKLKVGFGRDRDLANVRMISESLRPGERFMLDANQAWDLDTAGAMLRELAAFPVEWIEEPLRCDRPIEEWRRLAEASPIPLAAGENIRSLGEFRAAFGHLAFVQPDACKWGGVSGCLEAARAALAAGRVYCPHYLGGGVGLLTSAHLLAAAGGPGLLEIDVNPNPLREGLAAPHPRLDEGVFTLPGGPGLGVEPDDAAVAEFLRSSYVRG